MRCLSMDRRDETIVRKILKYCGDIEEANTHFDDDKALFFDEALGNVYRNAVSMPLLQIGELAKHFSPEFIAAHSAVPWKEIIRMRDFFAHHYGNASFDQIWTTAHEDVADLRSFLLAITR